MVALNPLHPAEGHQPTVPLSSPDTWAKKFHFCSNYVEWVSELQMMSLLLLSVIVLCHPRNHSRLKPPPDFKLVAGMRDSQLSQSKKLPHTCWVASLPKLMKVRGQLAVSPFLWNSQSAGLFNSSLNGCSFLAWKCSENANSFWWQSQQAYRVLTSKQGELKELGGSIRFA